LYRSGDVELPTPEKLLGDLFGKEKEQWPNFKDTTEREPYLRETKEHQDLLYYFAKTVLLREEYKRNHTSNNLSDYMKVTLEAFLVLTYVNGYAGWKEEMDRQQESSTEGEVSDISNVSSRLYTDKARGTGKYKGWSKEGIILYNRVVEDIQKQRMGEEVDLEVLKEFDSKLKERFVGGEGEAQQRIEEEDVSPVHVLVESFLEAPNAASNGQQGGFTIGHVGGAIYPA
jgi:hypothetical protein